MKLYSLLNEENVLIGEQPQSLEEALRRLLATFGPSINTHSPEELVSLLMERERQNPSILGEGVCLPHSRLEGLDRFLVGLMVFERPIEHEVEKEESPQPIQMVVLILAPQNKNTMMLQTMGAVARLLRSKKVKQGLLGVKSAPRLIRLIEETGIDVKRTLVSSDIMSPIEHSVTADTLLAPAVDVLVEAPDEGIPVLNKQGRLIGELTSRELLTLGMPKYLHLIVNPAMLENFEPFENFFRNENTITVREVCRRDVLTVEPTTPVIQVAQQMLTRQRRRIYVVEDNELKGIIYRKSIVNRVLHY